MMCISSTTILLPLLAHRIDVAYLQDVCVPAHALLQATFSRVQIERRTWCCVRPKKCTRIAADKHIAIARVIAALRACVCTTSTRTCTLCFYWLGQGHIYHQCSLVFNRYANPWHGLSRFPFSFQSVHIAPELVSEVSCSLYLVYSYIFFKKMYKYRYSYTYDHSLIWTHTFYPYEYIRKTELAWSLDSWSRLPRAPHRRRGCRLPLKE
jgi:hypothetical protein